MSQLGTLADESSACVAPCSGCQLDELVLTYQSSTWNQVFSKSIV
jgi:hypothetical protein